MTPANLDKLFAFLKANKTLKLQLGEFKIVKTLGQGGKGIVYEAGFNDNLVAIKFLITDATGGTRY